MERVKGIEPSYEAWEAAVLPLNYTRILLRIIGSACGLTDSNKVNTIFYLLAPIAGFKLEKRWQTAGKPLANH